MNTNQNPGLLQTLSTGQVFQATLRAVAHVVDEDMSDMPELEALTPPILSTGTSNENPPAEDIDMQTLDAEANHIDNNAEDDSLPELNSVSESSEQESDDADEVEMMQDLHPVDDDNDSSWTDEENGPNDTPTFEQIQPHRNTRRARVDEDDDEDRDRRHPSQRIASGNASANNISNDNNQSAPPSPPRPALQPLPPTHSRHTMQFGFGPIPPPPGTARLFNNFHPQNQTSNSGPVSTGQGAPPPENPTTFATGFSVMIDAHGTHVSPFIPRMMGLGPTTLGAGPPIVGVNGDGRPNMATITDFIQRLGVLGFNLGVMREAFGFGQEEMEDPQRAKLLVDGLEQVPVGLVRRLERVGGAPGGCAGDGTTVDENAVVEGCAICWDQLLDGDGESWVKGKADDGEKEIPPPEDVGHAENVNGVEAMAVDAESEIRHDPPSPSLPSESLPVISSTTSESADDPKSKYPTIVSLPCAHVFHASCLIPWFSRPRQSTCPTCRFNVDPENLTYVRRPRRTPAGANAGQAGAAAASAGVEAQQEITTPADQAHAVLTPSETAGVTGNVGLVPEVQDAQPEHAQNIPTTAGTGRQPAPAAANDEQNTPGVPEGFLTLGFDVLFGMPRMQGENDAGVDTRMSEMEAQMAMGVDANADADTDVPGDNDGGGIFEADPSGRAELMQEVRRAQDAIHQMLAPLLEDGNTPGSPPTANVNTPAAPPPNHNAGETPAGAIPAPHQDFRQFFLDMGGANTLPGMRAFPVPGPGPTPAGAGSPLPAFAQMFGEVLVGEFPAPIPPIFSQRAPGTGIPPTGLGAAVPPTGNPLPPRVAPLGADLAGSPPTNGRPMNQFFAEILRLGGGAEDAPPGGLPPLFHSSQTNERPREKKQWTPPTPPGPTLRQRVEQKEREACLRCFDASCGVGPSDEEPMAVMADGPMKQLLIRPFRTMVVEVGLGRSVCAHTFHPSCLVSAERVALKGANENVHDREVEVTCPVCRVVGCISKEEWEEGVHAL